LPQTGDGVAVAQIIKALIKSVFPKAWYKRIRGAYWRSWDLWHGVETSLPADVSAMSVVGRNQSHANNYEAFGTVRQIIKELPIDHKQYGFVDLGSGKGRVLLEASGFPFIFVEGVEISIGLHEVAERNIRRYRFAKRRCGNVKATLGDATEFVLPTIPLVIYMFHPFSEPLLRSVMDGIRQSIAAHPRDIFIVFTGTLRFKDVIEKTAGIQIVSQRTYYTVYRLPNGHLA